MVGVAVNVTGLPAQIVAPLDVIATDAVTAVETVMVIAFEVAGEPVVQLKPEVMTTVIMSLLISEVEV